MSIRQVRIADVARVKGLIGGPFGSSLVGTDYENEGVPVIRGTNLGYGKYVAGQFAFVSEEKVARDLTRNTASAGDLVFTQRGTLGQVAIVPENSFNRYVISQSQMRLRADPSVAVPDFLYYACSSPLFRRQIADNAISTGVPHINLGILGRLTIPLPSLSEQRAITEVLSALDDKIAANVSSIETVDQLLEALHRRATMTSEAVARPLFGVVRVEFGEAFKGSEFTPVGQGRPLIRIRDLKTFESQVWTSEKREREVVVSPGDVIVGMDAEFRPTTWTGTPGLLNQRVCRVRGTYFGNAFVREALKAPLLRIENSKSATTVIHLNKSDMERMEVLMPARAELTAFEAVAEPAYAQRISAAMENRTLAEIRDALLPALMSGKLRVKEAAKTLEGVL